MANKDTTTTSGGLGRAAGVAAILLVGSLVSVADDGSKTRSSCAVPVNVLAPDFASYSKDDAARVLARWEEQYRGNPVTRGWDAPSFVSLGFVWVPFWTLERGLPAAAFTAKQGKHSVSIESVGIEQGARRIAFVLDNGPEMDADGRKVEAAVVGDILSKARAVDTFSLLTIRGPRVALHLGSGRGALRAATDRLAQPTQGKVGGESLLEGILEAVSWLHPPQNGDSILAMSVLAESKRNATFALARRELAAGRIRLFDFQLEGRVPPTHYDWTNEGGDSSIVEMYKLVRGSGGVEVKTQFPIHPLTELRMSELINNGEQMYNAMTEYYLLRISSIGPHFSISLSPEFQRRLPMAMMLYPWDAPPCSQ